MVYKMGQDREGNPLQEERFYRNVSTGEIILLHRAAAGFRVEFGFYGERANIFNIRSGEEYLPLSKEEILLETEKCQKRSAWLRRGLIDKISVQEDCKEPNLRKMAMDAEF